MHGDRNVGLVGLGRSARARGGSVPHSAAVSGDVNLRGVVGIEKDAMAPLEVVSLDSFPTDTAVDGAIGGSIETGDIEIVGMMGIDGQVINVLRLRKECLPCLAAVVGAINAAVSVGIIALPVPMR